MSEISQSAMPGKADSRKHPLKHLTVEVTSSCSPLDRCSISQWVRDISIVTTRGNAIISWWDPSQFMFLIRKSTRSQAMQVLRFCVEHHFQTTISAQEKHNFLDKLDRTVNIWSVFLHLPKYICYVYTRLHSRISKKHVQASSGLN